MDGGAILDTFALEARDYDEDDSATSSLLHDSAALRSDIESSASKTSTLPARPSVLIPSYFGTVHDSVGGRTNNLLLDATVHLDWTTFGLDHRHEI